MKDSETKMYIISTAKAKGLWCCGYFSSKGTKNFVSIHDIMDSMKHKDIFEWKSVCFCQLGWISQWDDDTKQIHAETVKWPAFDMAEEEIPQETIQVSGGFLSPTSRLMRWSV